MKLGTQWADKNPHIKASRNIMVAHIKSESCPKVKRKKRTKKRPVKKDHYA